LFTSNEVRLGELVARELGDLGVVHLDAVDADELLDDAPRPLVEPVGALGGSHCKRWRVLNRLLCQKAIDLAIGGGLISIFFPDLSNIFR
jgi:hypothetical protein